MFTDLLAQSGLDVRLVAELEKTEGDSASCRFVSGEEDTPYFASVSQVFKKEGKGDVLHLCQHFSF